MREPVRAAGQATIEAKGESYEVVVQEIVCAKEVAASLRRTWRLFGMDRHSKAKRLSEPGMS